MSQEELIESEPRPRSVWQRTGVRALRHPAVVAALLVLGILAGSIGGFVVGQRNPGTLAGLGYVFLGSGFSERDFDQFQQTYGRAPLPTLTLDDLTDAGRT